MALEDLLREAAAKGLTHLTVYPVQSHDGKTTYWHARATPSTGHQYVHKGDTDMIAAITGVLTELPKAKRRTLVFSPSENAMKLTNGDAPPVTAAVTEQVPEPQPAGELDQWLPKA